MNWRPKSLRKSGLTLLTGVALLLTIVGALSIPSLAQDKKPIKWRLSASWSGGPLLEDLTKAFVARVDELSDGALQISAYPAGVLGNPLQVTDTVKNGVAQAGNTWVGYDWGREKTSVAFAGTAGGMSSEALLAWLYAGGGAELFAKWRLERFGVVAVPLGVRSAEVFLHSRKPVRTLADMNGLKVRTTGAWIDILRDLGASPVSSSGGEVYQLLERGAVDAVEWGTPAENLISGYHKVAKYTIVPGVHQNSTFFELQINKAAWETLSPTLQKIVREAARSTTYDYWAQDNLASAQALDTMIKEGAELIVLDEEVQSKAAELGRAWAQKIAESDTSFKEVFDHQQKFLTQWKSWAPYRKGLGTP